MTKADTIFKENIRKIMEEGVWSEQARPKYKDGRTANSKYITGAFMEFDLAKGEFPITTLRPIAIKSAIKEMLWIYQDQSNSLDLLEDKYNVHYWNDWEVGDSRTIGQRYGAVVKKHDITNKILKQLEANPWNRRNIISLWDLSLIHISEKKAMKRLVEIVVSDIADGHYQVFVIHALSLIHISCKAS